MGYLTVKVNLNDLGLSTKLISAANRAEHAVAVEAAKDTEPYVPMLTGSFKNRTQVRDNLIIYPGPSARYLYYGKVMVNAKTGKGPGHFVDKKGNEVLRFPKGSKLKATDRDLVFTTTYHPDAQSHWFEVSKAENLERWKQVAARAVTRYDGK